MQFLRNLTPRTKLIFAVMLVFLILGVVFFIFLQTSSTKGSITIPTPTVSQNQQEVAPDEKTNLNTQDAEAISLVESLKEIQDEKKRTATNNTELVIEIDSHPSTQDNSYVVHVYEIVPDGDGTAHTATFGWYRVDLQTDAVIKTE